MKLNLKLGTIAGTLLTLTMIGCSQPSVTFRQGIAEKAGSNDNLAIENPPDDLPPINQPPVINPPQSPGANPPPSNNPKPPVVDNEPRPPRPADPAEKCPGVQGQPFREGYLGGVFMNIDHIDIAAEDGAVYPASVPHNFGNVNFFDLANDVLGTLKIDQGAFAGRWQVKEIRLYFNNDMNHFMNFNGVPLCRYLPEIISKPGVVLQVNAFSRDIYGASKLTLPYGACHFLLLPDGDCSLSKTFQVQIRK